VRALIVTRLRTITVFLERAFEKSRAWGIFVRRESGEAGIPGRAHKKIERLFAKQLFDFSRLHR